MTPESKLLADVIAYLKKLRKAGRPICWTKYHGGAMSRGGEPDLCIVAAGRPVFVELKSERGATTRLQEKRLADWQGAGATVGVARSVEDVAGLLGKDTDQ